MANNTDELLISIGNNDDFLPKLPIELIAYVFSYTDPKTIHALSQVCHYFLEIIKKYSKLIFCEHFHNDFLTLLPADKNFLLSYQFKALMNDKENTRLTSSRANGDMLRERFDI